MKLPTNSVLLDDLEPEHRKVTNELLGDLGEFQKILKSEGVIRETLSAESFEKFAAMELEQKTQIMEDFKSGLEIYQDVLAKNESLRDNTKMIWRMLARHKLTPTSDLFDHIKEDDVVEAYNYKNIQIFRNVRFYDVVSYPILEVLVNTWPELFTREDKYTGKLMEIAGGIFQGVHKGTTKVPLGDHLIDETAAHGQHTIMANNKMISPCKDKEGNVVVIVANAEAKVVKP